MIDKIKPIHTLLKFQTKLLGKQRIEALKQRWQNEEIRK